MIRRSKPITRSTTPLKRTPIPRRRKGEPRRGARKDEDFKAFVRKLPCWVCYQTFWEWLQDQPESSQVELFAMFEKIGWRQGRQSSRSEHAHVGFSTSRRGLSQKYPDNESLPLCRVEHHQFGSLSIHKLQAGPFFEHHKIDRDGSILFLQRLFKLCQEKAS